MTTFEIIITVAIIANVLLLLAIVIQFGVFLNRGDGTVWLGSKLSSINSKAQSIVDEVGQINARIDGFIPAFNKLLEHNESIENFWACDSSLVIKLLKELVDIEHKSDERNDNMFPFMQKIMRNYNPPCYSPDGICTNPQMDCINCPKRGTGGTWSTSTNIIKVKGKRCELTDEELMKRINEDNKED